MFETSDTKYVWAIWKKKTGKWYNIAEKPEKLAELINGVLSAIHYWVLKGLNTVIDKGKVEEDVINLIVDAINKNTSSRDKRRASYQGGKYIFKKKEKEYKIGTKIKY